MLADAVEQDRKMEILVLGQVAAQDTCRFLKVDRAGGTVQENGWMGEADKAQHKDFHMVILRQSQGVQPIENRMAATVQHTVEEPRTGWDN